MKTIYCHVMCGLLLALCTASLAVAETRYVSDSLVITVRELPDDTSTRIKNIVTDTAFESLEESGGYLKVQLQDGTVGYVKARYTTSKTPKPTIIKSLTSENSKLKKQYEELTASLGDKESAGVTKQKQIKNELEKVKKELAQKSTANSQLKTDFANLNKQHNTLKTNSGNVVQIMSQSEKLRADNERLQIEFETLQSENALLLRTAVIKWVLAGAGILFLGWIMGKVSRNKRRYGGA